MNTALDRFRQFLDGGSAIITSKENMRHLCGFSGGEGALLVTPDRMYLFSDSRYTLQAAEQAKTAIFIEISRTAPLFSCLKEKLHHFNITTVYFEDLDASVSQYNKLKSELGAEFLPLGSALFEIRRKKSVDELYKISEAVRLADEAFSNVIKFIKPGRTETEVAAELEFFMRKNGASGTSFETICASGARGALPHGAATQKEILKGEPVVLDFGCVLDGYCSDITRTVVAGKASEKIKEVYNVVLYAQGLAECRLAPGTKACDIDKVARDAITAYGYGGNFTHALGHGVGLNVHESPVASPSSDAVLAEGDILTIEPGIYLEGEFGIRIEDMTAVCRGGYAVLTKSEKSLLEIF